MQIGLDFGHGGKDTGAIGPTGLEEKNVNLEVGLQIGKILERHGLAVVYTRINDQYVSLTERTGMLNTARVDYAVSIHCNVAEHRGADYITSFIIATGGQAEKLAGKIQKNMVAAIGWADGGVKVKNLHMVRATTMPAVLVEMGFISNPEQEAQLKNQLVREAFAVAIAKGILEHLGIGYQSVEPVGTFIQGKTVATVEQARAWARERGATETFIKLANLYWSLAPEVGVRADVAYAQSAKETGFGRFGGVIDESYHNPCGLKTSKGGDNYDPDAHQRFVDWSEGIVAHLDHLALYAGAKGYPKENTPDPRHFPYIYGTAKTVEELGGSWAPSPEYGRSLVNEYLLPLLAIEVNQLDWKTQLIQEALDLGWITERREPTTQVEWWELIGVLKNVLKVKGPNK